MDHFVVILYQYQPIYAGGTRSMPVRIDHNEEGEKAGKSISPNPCLENDTFLQV